MAWFDEAEFYHIYPLGMTGAQKENHQEEVSHRFGQMNAWLPHIEQLGCTAIYIGPLFESTTHGYDTRDYRLVDRRLGDNQDFKEFVALAHERGIKVVVDGVFNHTGREFFAFKDIQKNRESSLYRNWYKGVDFGGNTWYNDGFHYEAWRNCYELVNLNLWEPAVREYLLDVIDFWIDEFDIDGIRLDCADCLEFSFMEEMRRRTAQKKSDFWLMGEVIHGDYSRYVKDSMLHSVTNYELHKGLYSGHNDHNYFEIAHTIRRQFEENGGIYRGLRLYSFVDNHDVDRIAEKLKDFRHIFSVYGLLYTLPGIPSIYYGSEWGIGGRKEGGNDDPLRPYISEENLQKKEPHPEVEAWIACLGKMRKERPECVWGAYRELLLTNRQYAFARILEQAATITAANNDENEALVYVPVPVAGKTYRDNMTGEEYCPENGKIAVKIPAGGCKIISSTEEGEG